MTTLLSLLQHLLAGAKKNPTYYAILILACISVYEYTLIRDKGYELESMRVAYSNPAVKEVIKTVNIKGPVRIEYRTIVEKVAGEKEIVEKIVYREAEVTVKDSEKESKPIVIEERCDNSRILLGLSKSGFGRGNEYDSLHAGYSIYNRLDLIGGVSLQKDRIYTVQAMFRI